MKRGRKASTDPEHVNRAQWIRSTYLLESSQKECLSYVAFAEGIDQSDIVRAAINEHLRQHYRIDPNHPPLRPELRKAKP